MHQIDNGFWFGLQPCVAGKAAIFIDGRISQPKPAIVCAKAFATPSTAHRQMRIVGKFSRPEQRADSDMAHGEAAQSRDG